MEVFDYELLEELDDLFEELWLELETGREWHTIPEVAG